MNVLDVFKGDAFGVVSMTTAINTLPYQPGRVGQLKIFKSKPVPTTSVLIEKQEGKLCLIASTPRGVTGGKQPSVGRTARSLPVPHFELSDTILADSIQNVREFGTGDQLKGITTEVNNRLANLRACHETQHEYMRLGALKGQVIDGDASTVLVNLFTEFGISQPTIDFELDVDTTNVKGKITQVMRTIQTALGGSSFTGILALCGDAFYDNLANHAKVVDAFRYQNDAASKYLLNLQGQGYEAPRFEFGGIIWENYRGQIGDAKFVADKKCQFVPLGVPDLFEQFHAPAPYIEAVNTPGQPVYAKQAVQKFETGIDLTSNSNFLPICNRPGVLVEGTDF